MKLKSSLYLCSLLSIASPLVSLAVEGASTSEVSNTASDLADHLSDVVAYKSLSDELKAVEVSKSVGLAVRTTVASLSSKDSALQYVLEIARAAGSVAHNFSGTIISSIVAACKEAPVFAGMDEKNLTELVTAAVDQGDAEEAQAEPNRRRRERNSSEYRGRSDDHIVSPSSSK